MTRLSENPFGDRFPITVAPGAWPGTFEVGMDGSYATVTHGEGEAVARLDHVGSLEPGRGIGTELTLVAAQEAAARGATELHAGIIDETEMRIFARLFGSDNLIFVDERPDATYELPLTLPQAVASIALADAAWRIYKAAEVEPPADFDPGIETRVELTNPDVQRRIGTQQAE